MAKTIIDASLTITPLTSAPAGTRGQQEVVRVVVECPTAEFAALIVLAGLTNAIPSATQADITTKIAALVAARAINPIP